MTDLEAQLAALEQRLAAVEARAEREHGGLLGLWREVFPAEARAHMRAARKEQLLAARALLDHWIARLEKEPSERLPRRESISLD
jgi:uncharacterized protein YciW